MYQSLSEFFADARHSGKDWIKSQIKLSAITFVLLLVGLFVADIVCEKKLGTGIALDLLIPFIAIAIAIIDAVPVRRLCAGHVVGVGLLVCQDARVAKLNAVERNILSERPALCLRIH